jgi:hypothetical protein
MIPYGRQSVDESDIARVADVLRSDWLTQGPALLEFEERLGELTGADHAVAFSSGTAALHAAAAAGGLGPGDVVATTPLTLADVGTNHSVTMAAGSTLTGMSGATLTSAVVNTALIPFRVTGLWSDVGAPNSIGTDDTSNYNWVIVTANVAQNTGI